ncbi:RluA family pseudouridine synthase [Ruminococcus sp. CLA-AA-H200]|uniref:RNA pseudouridylate synthase n=1 Tax=Ruminococcus turbiniformis TaxID=2881258 RepID=A0ABS8FTW8_9FIRM|nr:RluA family pseudouridine synthase [Ruminococcus turbiniformis]MCC2252954.1 RluA family pseudouridine synthase [Ruminococcus turbiniformis]
MKPDINEMILYEDKHIIVCRKPAGIAVQSSRIGTPDMVSLLKNHLASSRARFNSSGSTAPVRTSGSGDPYLAVIHRLDQPVAGFLVFAKTPAAAKDLNRQLTASGFGKYYMALVSGVPSKKEGTLEDYLIRDGRTNTSRVCEKNVSGAKKAVLHYQVEEVRGGTSLVRIRLDTGRHHQIRVQMAHIGCPLIGDRKYGRQNSTDQSSEMPGGTGSQQPLCLFAYRLEFAHPEDHRKMEFMEPFPYFD